MFIILVPEIFALEDIFISEGSYNLELCLEFIIIGKNKPKTYRIIIIKADIRNALMALIFII